MNPQNNIKERYDFPLCVTEGMINFQTAHATPPIERKYTDLSKATHKIQGPEPNLNDILDAWHQNQASPFSNRKISNIMSYITTLKQIDQLSEEDLINSNSDSYHTIIPKLEKELDHFKTTIIMPNYLKKALDLGTMKVNNYYALQNAINKVR